MANKLHEFPMFTPPDRETIEGFLLKLNSDLAGFVSASGKRKTRK
jgi:hypothetical protein